MSMTAERRKEIFQAFRRDEKDTGSPEVQIALLTEHIVNITAHLAAHKKDFHSRRGLVRMVNTRRSLLDYLKKKRPHVYQDILKRLKLRR